MLDRYFVHRLRRVTGKDANPLNERSMLLVKQAVFVIGSLQSGS